MYEIKELLIHELLIHRVLKLILKIVINNLMICEQFKNTEK